MAEAFLCRNNNNIIRTYELDIESGFYKTENNIAKIDYYGNMKIITAELFFLGDFGSDTRVVGTGALNVSQPVIGYLFNTTTGAFIKCVGMWHYKNGSLKTIEALQNNLDSVLRFNYTVPVIKA